MKPLKNRFNMRKKIYRATLANKTFVDCSLCSHPFKNTDGSDIEIYHVIFVYTYCDGSQIRFKACPNENMLIEVIEELGFNGKEVQQFICGITKYYVEMTIMGWPIYELVESLRALNNNEVINN